MARPIYLGSLLDSGPHLSLSPPMHERNRPSRKASAKAAALPPPNPFPPGVVPGSPSSTPKRPRHVTPASTSGEDNEQFSGDDEYCEMLRFERTELTAHIQH